MAVVTTAELATSMGGWQYTGVQELTAQQILDGIQSDLERYLNRPIQRRRVLELAKPDPNGVHYLAVTPIVALHGVYEVNDEGDKGRLATNLYDLHFNPGANWIKFGRFPFFVDYTGGINGDVDPGMKLAIKRVAARDFGYMFDNAVTVSDTEGRAPEQSSPPLPKGWTDDELKRFDRNRRRTVL